MPVGARDRPGGARERLVRVELDRALDGEGKAHSVIVRVRDNGTGMDEETRQRLFDPFFTTKEIGKGTGLGLAMVYGIVTQSGGFLHAISEVGKGTRFIILLPRHQRTADEKDMAEAPKDHKGKPIAAAFGEGNESDNEAPREEDMDLTGQSAVVLLVEDEDAVRTFAARALGTRGYEVLQAESGEVALDVVRAYEGRIDLVVSDVVMPNMDGPTMAKELKGLLPGTPIIFVSGYAEDAFAKNLDPDQEFHFLPKPFSLKQLAAAVKEVMGNK